MDDNNVPCDIGRGVKSHYLLFSANICPIEKRGPTFIDTKRMSLQQRHIPGKLINLINLLQYINKFFHVHDVVLSVLFFLKKMSHYCVPFPL